MLKAIINIFSRELKSVAKDVNIISLIILAPVFYSLFYGSMYINKVERELPVVVLDNDRSETSKSLLRRINAHQIIDIIENVPDYKSGIEAIQTGKAVAMIFIDNNFDSNIKLYKGATLKLYLNTNRFLPSNDINIAVNEAVIDYNTGIKLKFFELAGYSPEQAKELTEPLRYEVRSLFNFTESYGDFLVPGILILVIQQTLIIGLAESMAKEREENTLGGLNEMSCGNIFSMIQGKGALYLILYSAYSFFFFTFHYWLFNIKLEKSIFALSVFTLLLIIAAIYFTIFIASFFKRKIIALQFLTLTTYPIFLISGYSWPAFCMPQWVKYAAGCLPSTPYLAAFTRITKMGANIQQTMPELYHLLGLTIVLYLAAHLRLKSLTKKQISNNEVTQ